jgi:hypothetical protein
MLYTLEKANIDSFDWDRSYPPHSLTVVINNNTQLFAEAIRIESLSRHACGIGNWDDLRRSLFVFTFFTNVDSFDWERLGLIVSCLRLSPSNFWCWELG